MSAISTRFYCGSFRHTIHCTIEESCERDCDIHQRMKVDVAGRGW
jgi:hypothetical protein